jgi:ATP-dependent RNA helicase RhlE
MNFSDLGLSEPVLRALSAAGYQSPTPIQAQAIPHVLAGRDLFGCAQTGTGKTAAFALPVLHRLAATPAPNGTRKVRALVLTPTRELAAQIGESFETYGRHTPLRYAVMFGGVGIQRQIQTLARGVDVVVGTPGRLLDLLQQRALSLAHVNVFVLDEADRMLDMGFVHDVKRIAAMVPKARQTLMFSATLPDSIRSLAQSLLNSPAHVAVDAVSSAAETLDQSVYFVDKADKRALLAWVLQDLGIDRTLAFTRTKHGADRVVEYLQKRGFAAAALHGNKSQNARERALDAFKGGQLRVLVATDIAARGIDIEQLSHVINYEVPNMPESYVHRIGRSGRAGASGAALSFCTAEERPYLRSIERLIQKQIRVVAEHPHAQAQGHEEARGPQHPGQRRDGEARHGQHAGARRDGRDGRDGEARRGQHAGARRDDDARQQPGRRRRGGAEGQPSGGSPRREDPSRVIALVAGNTSSQAAPARPVKPGFSSPRGRRGRAFGR